MIGLIFTIIILGCALYLVETYIPMAPPIKVVLRVVIVLAIVWYLLRWAGIVLP